MDLGLKNRVAVVMAASQGLGKASAMSLAAEGCKIAICSRDLKNIKKSAAEIKEITAAEVLSMVVDVENREQIDNFMNMVQQKWGKIDILVTNAGGPPPKVFEETNDEEWEKYFRITLMSVIWAIKNALPVMKEQRWGRIINITSIAVKEPIVSLIYSNSLRSAVIGLAKTITREVGKYGITIHNVAPGFHKTAGLERIVNRRVEKGERADDIYREWEESIPLNRIGDPKDLAGLITFLASDQASYMSGNTIQVDGGKFSGLL